MKQRIITTCVLWLIVIAGMCWLGPAAGVWLLTLLGVLTQHEFYRLLERQGMRPQRLMGLIMGAIVISGAWYWPGAGNPDPGTDLLIFSIVILALTTLQEPAPEATSRFVPTLAGLVFIPFLLQFYIRLMREHAELGRPMTGLMLVVWLVAVAKFSDVGALLVGMRMGKTRLAPAISPGKTREGALGGVIVAGAVGGVLALVFHEHFRPAGLGFFSAVGLGAVLGLVAILSDLVESLLKRLSGVKDSGDAIPGIGGAFDLTDSLLLTAPLGFVLFKYLAL